MSAIQLSDELLSDIKKVLTSHDKANVDDDICIQYMAAIMGLQLARLPTEPGHKKKMLQQLFDFADHVLEDGLPKASAPPPQEAFGIWKPE
jgi:hypothetical protein